MIGTVAADRSNNGRCAKEKAMSNFERKILAELRCLREAERSLAGKYNTLRGACSQTVQCFIVSMRRLDKRIDRLENLLERVA
jgi:hypothetical protein